MSSIVETAAPSLAQSAPEFVLPAADPRPDTPAAAEGAAGTELSTARLSLLNLIRQLPSRVASPADSVTSLNPNVETFTCPSRRCEAKRERQHKPGSQVLFSTEWREMKIAGMGVWVVDITVRCPECDLRQSRTLIPPVLIPALARLA